MDQVETSGKTVEDALKKALARLGATMDDVEFVVLDEGRKGGLFGRGAKDALVRVERVRGSAPAAPAARQPADTSIPRRGQAPRGRRDAREGGRGGARPDDRVDRGDRGGRGGGRTGGRRSFEEPAPRLTEEAFRMPGAPTPQPQTGRGRGGPGERAPRRPDAERPPREPSERPRREPRKREDEPYIEPNIDAPAVEYACRAVDDMLRILEIDAEISYRAPESPGDGLGMALAVIDLQGEDLGLLIGRRGETLNALQYIVNLMLGRQFPDEHAAVTIDVEQYRKRRELQLIDLAGRMADRVRQTGSAITLEPMTPAERRIIHLTLVDDPDLMTHSIGEGESRKVVISTRE